MARMRSGGGLAIAMVILGVGFLLSLILAILFYTRIEQAEANMADAQEELAEYVNAEEATSDVVTRALASDEGTVVGLLLETIQDLRATIGPGVAGSPEALRAERERLGVTGTLASFIQQQNDQIATLRDELAAAVDARRQAEDNLAALEGRIEAAQAQFTQDVAELRAELEAVPQSAEREVVSARQQVDRLERRMVNETREMSAEVSQLQAQISQKDAEIQNLRDRVADLVARLTARGQVTEQMVRPDGQVVSILSEQGLVYINKGRNDQIILGMQFEVYDRNELIRVSPISGELRGKATIEVIRINDDASVARIVRLSRNEIVGEGDVIANVIYNEDATMRFFVYGDFDLDNAGRPTRRDTRRVEGLIDAWGGELVDELNYDVDYVVLGEQPEFPEEEPSGLDLEELAAYQERLDRYERFQAVLNEARELRVPILNQNRFLTLIGFYDRRSMEPEDFARIRGEEQ